MSSRHVFAKASLMVACLSVGLAAQARGAVVTAPYSPADMTDFTTGNTGNGGTWTNTFENTIYDGVGDTSSSAVVDTTGVAGQNFTVKTDFHVKSWSADAWIVGVSALSDNANLGGDYNGNKFYAATVRFDGGGQHLDIVTNNPYDWGTSLVPAGQVTAPGTLGDCSLTLHGTYDLSGNLTLSATLVDTSNSANNLAVTASQIAVANIGSGTNFGLRNAAYWGGGDIQYSNFSINAVPEPTSMALLGLGGLSLLARRRKSA